MEERRIAAMARNLGATIAVSADLPMMPDRNSALIVMPETGVHRCGDSFGIKTTPRGIVPPIGGGRAIAPRPIAAAGLAGTVKDGVDPGDPGRGISAMSAAAGEAIAGLALGMRAGDRASAMNRSGIRA
jgi:hypothetical protein